MKDNCGGAYKTIIIMESTHISSEVIVIIGQEQLHCNITYGEDVHINRGFF